jgi:hypothetical protein
MVKRYVLGCSLSIPTLQARRAPVLEFSIWRERIMRAQDSFMMTYLRIVTSRSCCRNREVITFFDGCGNTMLEPAVAKGSTPEFMKD